MPDLLGHLWTQKHKKSYKRIKNRKTFDKIQKNLHQGSCPDADFSAVLRGLEYDTEASESSKSS